LEQQRAVEDEDIAAQLMALKPMTEAEIDEIFVKNNVGDSEFLCDQLSPIFCHLWNYISHVLLTCLIVTTKRFNAYG
jgi:hypothetical protein